MQKNNNKKIFFLILIIAVILILVGGYYWYSRQIGDLFPNTSREISFSVNDEGQAKFWSEEDPDLEPLLSLVESEEQGFIEWKGERFDGLGELSDSQNKVLSELFASPYGQELPLIALENACRSDSDLTAQQIAALLYPWQMHLKYSPVDRTQEIEHFIETSGCADFFSQPSTANIKEDDPFLIYSNAASIPVVFGYFPFDGEGAFELESSSSIIDKTYANILPIAFQAQANEPVNQKTDEMPYDQFGPCDSKCRGACGADCTSNNCEVEEVLICQIDEKGEYTGFQVYADRYICGIHPGCVEHDNCYDECNKKYGCKTWKAAWCRHSGTMLGLADGCDRKAQRQYGTPQCIAWARGYPGPLGTFDTYKAFDYERRPKGHFRISNPEVCKESEAVEFTIRMEMIEEPLMDSLCRPGKSVFVMTLWNVGAAGGDEYALVDISESRYVDYRVTKDDCEVIDYGDIPDAEDIPPVHFSGGPNGTITALLEEEEEILLGEFVDGKVFLLDEDFWTARGWSNYSPREFPVPNPSVFEGLE